MNKTTMYYGKQYGLVFSSNSRQEVSIYADVLNKIFGDYNSDKKRVTLQNMKQLILIDHVTTNGKESHGIYIKEPYDKLVRNIK